MEKNLEQLKGREIGISKCPGGFVNSAGISLPSYTVTEHFSLKSDKLLDCLETTVLIMDSSYYGGK